MSELEAKPALLRVTLQITRAATGETETVELIGTPIEPPTEENDDERHPLDRL